ncbi:reverse transcriptase domain-containing protein [Tanacetum coccineum]
MTGRNGRQHPICYVSKVLHEAEKNYAPLEKLALALRNASRRLRRYFEAHPITIITYHPIKQILGRAETSGRLAQYAVELGAYKITYKPRNSIKGQVLADFLNEIPIGNDTLVSRETTYTKEDKKDRQEEWMLFTDGASSSKGSSAGLAEYEALLAGLRIEKKMGVQALSVKVDSKLLPDKKHTQEPEPKSRCAKQVSFGSIQSSMDCEEINTIVEEEGENWMSPIIRCLEEGIWPEDENEARALRMKINQYVMEEGVLFKRSYLMSMLRCVGPLQANYVIREIHMGACSMHMKPRSVVAKAIRQGYYWPTMHRDAREEIRKCDSCQIHAPVPKMPKTLMTSIMAPWPFYQWGMDVLGPLPEAPGKVKYVIVAIDYFTKWIEAKPLARTTGKEVKKICLG